MPCTYYNPKKAKRKTKAKTKPTHFSKTEHMNQGRISMHTESGSFPSLFFYCFLAITLAEKKMPHQLLCPKLCSFLSALIPLKTNKANRVREGEVS